MMERLSKFTLYETKTRLYFVGTDSTEKVFQIAKIDRTVLDELAFVEDSVLYTKKEIEDLLGMIENGNKITGGLRKITGCFGIFGFVRFLEGYYAILITKRSAVALLGGHYIYHIDETIMFNVYNTPNKSDKKQDEARYLQIFGQVDINKNFYYSYSYDITSSLQQNLLASNATNGFSPNDMFIWNSYLINDAFPNQSVWRLNIIHGFVDQSKICVFGHNIFVTLIARRSKYYAGARYLKRGVNDQGYVANDVETEQIVHDASTTSFYIPPGRYGSCAGYTSFLQHRGSIPVYWSQEATAMAAKPQIELNFIDPFHAAAAKHFNDMFHRYGTPIIVLNLVKTKEKVKRESILLDRFTEAISYLNIFLPSDKEILYIAWDMARASKSTDQDVIGVLESLAEQVLATTWFFHSGAEPLINAERRAGINSSNPRPVEHRTTSMHQHGILRTNCVDCLDRTNAAQFVVGKCALGHQLYALGLITTPIVPFDCDAVNLLNAMYHDHGDTIALQYGGSHLVNTMETYRKISPWTSHSRDMIETIRRFYSNSFTDAEKQDAINLFLGNYSPKMRLTPLWDLLTDQFLHNDLPYNRTPVVSYRTWWTSDAFDDNYKYKPEYNRHDIVAMFDEYYRPLVYTTFARLFAFNMIGTNAKTISAGSGADAPETTPFAVRTQAAKHLMIYSLDIGGVKRWMTLKSKPVDTSASVQTIGSGQISTPLDRSHRQAARRAIETGAALQKSTRSKLTANAASATIPNGASTEKANTEAKRKHTNSHWLSSSILAERLLEPKTVQVDEYKRYVQQFQPSSIKLTWSFDATAREHPDYKIFNLHIRRMADSLESTGNEPNLSVDPRDALIYTNFSAASYL
ncbi:hypothetical protein BDV3_005195 [Batrachochytrium dendrobatidis]|nr:phosphatidylinositol-3,5-bisphosphate 5-phosphatase [Batrachochytrium dendrobatidis]KAK5670588.1 phosphatidylinositol-3,5-bisphosphate 5-phosphatase [Batrachochytrium dendrobatidis]